MGQFSEIWLVADVTMTLFFLQILLTECLIYANKQRLSE